MKKMMTMGLGMAMGAGLMGVYMYNMPDMKKKKNKKMNSPYTASLTNVKSK